MHDLVLGRVSDGGVAGLALDGYDGVLSFGARSSKQYAGDLDLLGDLLALQIYHRGGGCLRVDGLVDVPAAFLAAASFAAFSSAAVIGAASLAAFPPQLSLQRRLIQPFSTLQVERLFLLLLSLQQLLLRSSPHQLSLQQLF
jgi:hypothetical protein